MLQVRAFEAKNTRDSLFDWVQKGKEIVISRHGKAVARLVPNVGGIDRAQAAARIRVRAGSWAFDWEKLKGLIGTRCVREPVLDSSTMLTWFTTMRRVRRFARVFDRLSSERAWVPSLWWGLPINA